MRSNSIFALLFKLLILSLTGFAITTGSALAATQCKPKLEKHGMWYYDKTKAKSSAKGRWEKQAGINHGIKFSFWNNAKNKSYKCKKHDNGTWRCKAIAKPCANITTCKPLLKKHGMWYYKKAKAQSSAKGRWEKQVSITHGIKFSFWNNAKNKSYKCKKHDNGTWRCEARAKPCH